jgi:uroporphyrinogen-III synthase
VTSGIAAMPSPLAGWRVLIGRPAGRSTQLIRMLAAEGASAQAVPLIDVLPPDDSAELDAVLMALAAGEPEWVVFTSVNAVAAVLDRARALRLIPAVPAGTRVAAVGPATSGALRRAGVAVDLVPGTGGTSSALAAVFPTARPGDSVALPRSDIGADTLPEALRVRGYQVLTAVAYRTTAAVLPTSVTEDLAAGRYQAVVVTSPSGVAALIAAEPAIGTAMIAIGEPTARALADAGTPADQVAEEPTERGIMTALLRRARHAIGSTAGESTPAESSW